jgi:hypothetical protein
MHAITYVGDVAVSSCIFAKSLSCIRMFGLVIFLWVEVGGFYGG